MRIRSSTTNSNRFKPPTGLIYLLGAITGGDALLAVAWSWYLRFEIRTGYDADSDIFLMLPRPGIIFLLVTTCLVALLIIASTRHVAADQQKDHLRRWGKVLGLGGITSALPFYILPHVLEPTSTAMGLLWHTLLPVMMLCMVARIFMLFASVPKEGQANRHTPLRLAQLVVIFFILVHLPSFWFAKPWESFFYRHQHLGGDEPRYLLLTHSLAQDQDFNLYNNWVENHRDQYICWSNHYRDPGDTFYAQRAIKQGAGVPHTKADYWHHRRYGIERIGMPLLIAPAYKAGLKFFARHRYGVVTMLNLILIFSMINIYLLAWRITKHQRAALLAAVTGGLSGPMLFYGVSVYTEPISAALLIFALRRIHEFAYPEKRNMPASFWFKGITLALAIAYLPWVHEKMLMFSTVLLMMTLILARPPRRVIALMIGIVAISAILQARYYWVLYGQFTPPAVHGLPFRIEKLLKEGFWGLLLDQKRGILPTAPWAFAGAAGLIAWVGKQKRFALWPLAMTTIFLISTGCFGGWYGGTCAQPRYPVNIMPIVAVGLAVAWANWKTTPWMRALMMGTASIGIIQGVTTVLIPRFLGAHRAPFWRDIYPIVFRLNPIEICVITAWMVLLCWGGLVLAKRSAFIQRTRLLPMTCGLIIIIGSAYRFMQNPRPQVAVWNRSLVRNYIQKDRRFLTFNKRIVMTRYQRAHSSEPLHKISMTAQTEAEKWAPTLSMADANAHGSKLVSWQADTTNAWSEVISSQPFSLYEGPYTATWTVRLPIVPEPPTPPASIMKLKIQASAGETIFNEIELQIEQDGIWQQIELPFALTDPRRGVRVRLLAKGLPRLQVDIFSLRYTSE